MAIVSFTPVVFANGKRADGSYNVKIRVYYKGKDRKLATTLTAYPEDLTKKLAIKSQSLKEKCSDLIKQMRKPLESLTFAQMEAMTVDDIIAYMKESQAEFRLDFFAYADGKIPSMKYNTAVCCKTALNAFEKYLGTRSLDFSRLTSSTLRGFQSWMEDAKGKQRRSTEAYLGIIRRFVNYARKEYNDETHTRIGNPFAYFEIPKSATPHHRDIEEDVIRAMIRERKSIRGQERIAVDVFLISFFLCGMNIPDLLECEKAKDGIIVFDRCKTRDQRTDRAETILRIEPEVRPLIDEYADSGRLLNLHRKYKSRLTLSQAVHKGLTMWSNEHEYGKVTFYSARHSVATLHYSLGTPRDIINDMISHVDKSMKMTDIYINKDWSRVWEAHRRLVLKILGEGTQL